MEKGIMTLPQCKSAVAMRREMLNTPAVMEVLTPAERMMFMASAEKPIADYSAVELAAELKDAMKWIAKDIGYRSTNEGDAQYLIIRMAEILKRHYFYLSMKDFCMAFEMLLVGELDDYLPKNGSGQPDRGHYQQFNAEYICKIIGAYRGRRSAVLRKAFAARPAEEQSMPPEMIDALHNRTKRDCVAAYEFFCANKLLPKISPIAEMLYYNLLSDAGLAPEIVVTEDEQRAILERTLSQFAGDKDALRRVAAESSELKMAAFKMARRKALKRAFEKLCADGVKLSDCIKFE